MSLIPNDAWEYFKDIQAQAFESFGKEDITFVKRTKNLNRYQEDTLTAGNFQTINLKCLISYNYYRVWGVNKTAPSGETEGQSIVLLLNKSILAQSNPELIDAKGNFIFDSATDHFIHRGMKYTPQGDTFLSQANNTPLLFMFILERDRKATGEKKGSL